MGNLGKLKKTFMSESGLVIHNFLSSTVIDGEENFGFWSKKKKKVSDVKMKKREKALFPRSCDESPNFVISLQGEMSSVQNQGQAPEGKKDSIVRILRYHRSKEMAKKKIPKICQKWAKMSKNPEKIKNHKISSCDKTYLVIKLTLTRPKPHIFFIFPNQKFCTIFSHFFTVTKLSLRIPLQKFPNSTSKISPNPNSPHRNPTQLSKPTPVPSLIPPPTPFPTSQNRPKLFPISPNPNPSRPPHPPAAHDFSIPQTPLYKRPHLTNGAPKSVGPKIINQIPMAKI
jgi:hypothetical protein